MSEPRHTPMDAAAWQGRVDDAETGDSRRWHQVVRPLRPGDAGDGDGGKDYGGGVALLGLCVDEGVRRNQGRPGARRGPAAIRGALAGLAWHGEAPLFDAGDLQCVEEDLEAFAEAQADRVRDLLDAGHLPLLLGGGHEIAWGNYTGLARHLDRVGWPDLSGKSKKNIESHTHHDVHRCYGEYETEIGVDGFAQESPCNRENEHSQNTEKSPPAHIEGEGPGPDRCNLC